MKKLHPQTISARLSKRVQSSYKLVSSVRTCHKSPGCEKTLDCDVRSKISDWSKLSDEKVVLHWSLVSESSSGMVSIGSGDNASSKDSLA